MIFDLLLQCFALRVMEVPTFWLEHFLVHKNDKVGGFQPSFKITTHPERKVGTILAPSNIQVGLHRTLLFWFKVFIKVIPEKWVALLYCFFFFKSTLSPVKTNSKLP